MRKSIYLLFIPILILALCILAITVYQNIASGISLSADDTDTSPSFKVNINTATAEELTYVPGIGASTASKIVSHRKQYGRFKKLEDLLQVKGIGQQTYDKISHYLTVGG